MRADLAGIGCRAAVPYDCDIALLDIDWWANDPILGAKRWAEWLLA